MGFDSTFACNTLNVSDLAEKRRKSIRDILAAHARCSIARVASAAPAASLCAGHVQQLGGASPLSDLMEVRVSNDARATVARRGLKEALSKCASRWTRTGYKALASGERATYREVHIHQRCEAWIRRQCAEGG
jgi:hypothetical protein